VDYRMSLFDQVVEKTGRTPSKAPPRRRRVTVSPHG